MVAQHSVLISLDACVPRCVYGAAMHPSSMVSWRVSTAFARKHGRRRSILQSDHEQLPPGAGSFDMIDGIYDPLVILAAYFDGHNVVVNPKSITHGLMSPARSIILPHSAGAIYFSCEDQGSKLSQAAPSR